MRRIAIVLSSAALVVMVGRAAVNPGQIGASSAASRQPTHLTAAEFDTLFKANNNWGRWGKDDALGSINLITDAKRKQAAALVKTGVAVSIAHPFSTEMAPDNPRPLVQTI